MHFPKPSCRFLSTRSTITTLYWDTAVFFPLLCPRTCEGHIVLSCTHQGRAHTGPWLVSWTINIGEFLKLDTRVGLPGTFVETAVEVEARVHK
jgi:hypothetical protein